MNRYVSLFHVSLYPVPTSSRAPKSAQRYTVSQKGIHPYHSRWHSQFAVRSIWLIRSSVAHILRLPKEKYI